MIQPNKKKARIALLNANGLLNCLRNYTFKIRKSFPALEKKPIP